MLTLKGLPFPAYLSRHLRPAAKTLQTRPIWTCLDCWRQLASVCTSDFQSGLLPHIQVQKTILLKAMLHKNLPGIVNPAVSPVYSIPESFSPEYFIPRTNMERCCVCPFSENKSLCFKIMNYFVAIIIIDYDSQKLQIMSEVWKFLLLLQVVKEEIRNCKE